MSSWPTLRQIMRVDAVVGHLGHFFPLPPGHADRRPFIILGSLGAERAGQEHERVPILAIPFGLTFPQVSGVVPRRVRSLGGNVLPGLPGPRIGSQRHRMPLAFPTSHAAAEVLGRLLLDGGSLPKKAALAHPVQAPDSVLVDLPKSRRRTLQSGYRAPEELET